MYCTTSDHGRHLISDDDDAVSPLFLSTTTLSLRQYLIPALLVLINTQICMTEFATSHLDAKEVTGRRYVVATTTIWSGASYVYNKDAVKILTDKERELRSGTGKKPDGDGWSKTGAKEEMHDEKKE